MKCPYCGAEVTSNFCPNCGSNLQNLQQYDQQVQQTSAQQQPIYQNYAQNMASGTSNVSPTSTVNQQFQPTRKKHSGLAIAAFVLSFLGPLAVIGLILGIVDLVKDKAKVNKHGLSIAAIVIGGIIVLATAGALGSDSTDSGNTSKKADVEKTEKSTEKVEKSDKGSAKVKEEKADENKKFGIGEEFGNKTITGVVIYADLDYKDYNDVWTQIDEGYKAVYIKIQVTNKSKKSNYVSVGDFKCYADDISTDAQVVTGSNEDYNANIDPGRSAILGALYVVPENTKSIELEYNPIGEFSSRQIIVVQDESTTGTQISAEGDFDKTGGVTISDDVNVIGIGDEFGNKTITGVVTDADLDFTGYNEYLTSVDADHKAIYLKIKVTNQSDESNYVSVGDFRCYVDDVNVTAEMVSDTNEDYNANIDPGRSAVLGGLYVIPKDAQSIELEYNPIGESSDRVIIKIQ